MGVGPEIPGWLAGREGADGVAKEGGTCLEIPSCLSSLSCSDVSYRCLVTSGLRFGCGCTAVSVRNPWGGATERKVPAVHGHRGSAQGKPRA